MSIPKKYVKPGGARPKGRASYVAEWRRPLTGKGVARSNDDDKDTLRLLERIGNRVAVWQEPCQDGRGKPIIVQVERFRVRPEVYSCASVSESAEHLRKRGLTVYVDDNGNARGRGDSTVQRRLLGSAGAGPDLGPQHSSAARRRGLYRETERNGTAKELDFLAFVYGPAYLNNRFAQPSLLSSLEEFAREATGQELPDGWVMQADYWLKKLKEWNKLEERHLRRARAEIDTAVSEGRMDDYASWQAIEQRILAFVERKRVLADAVVERDDNGEVIAVATAVRPAARPADTILAKIEAEKAKTEANKRK